MERELNKLFNDINYDKENMIIRQIYVWSIKREFPNYFWGVIPSPPKTHTQEEEKKWNLQNEKRALIYM